MWFLLLFLFLNATQKNTTVVVNHEVKVCWNSTQQRITPSNQKHGVGLIFLSSFSNQQLPFHLKLPVHNFLLLQHVFKKQCLQLCSVYDVFFGFFDRVTLLLCWMKEERAFFSSCVMCQMIVSLLYSVLLPIHFK